MSKTAISPTRNQDFAEWYQQVIKAAELAENSPVRGCMVIKPYGYAIWENIQKIFDQKLKKLDVQNTYFPLLVPVEFLSKESEHIDGFAKECAVVTHHRLIKNDSGDLVPDGKLASPYVIRPTSEAIIGNVVSNWIHSYRDLPLKLNQWCNVMRWEMRTRLFLRTSEFLWQEGHTVFATGVEAKEDARNMQDVYYEFITQDLSISGIKGEKPKEEKFPGAIHTYTVELMMQDGKALQAATSHDLGQSFSKAFDIKFSNQEGKECIAYTASWGITTRLIGAIIMSHADDDGLILPPSIAPYQVVIIPVFKNEEQFILIKKYCDNIKLALENAGIRAHLDCTDVTSSSKTWKWIKKGVPVRLEIGSRELETNSATLSRRDLGKDSKELLPIDELPDLIHMILQGISDNLYRRSHDNIQNKMQFVKDLPELIRYFDGGFDGFVVVEKSQTESEEFLEFAKKNALTRRCLIENFEPYCASECIVVARSY